MGGGRYSLKLCLLEEMIVTLKYCNKELVFFTFMHCGQNTTKRNGRVPLVTHWTD